MPGHDSSLESPERISLAEIGFPVECNGFYSSHGINTDRPQLTIGGKRT